MENILTKSTEIMAVLKKSADLIKTEKKPVVIFSDGGDKHDFSNEVRFAKSHGITVFFVPVASQAGTKLYDRYGAVVEDEAKRMVISARNPYIHILAEATGGLYMEDFDAAALLEAIREVGGAVETGSRTTRNITPFFVPLLLLAFLAFLAATVRLKRVVPAVALLLLFPASQTPLHAGVLGFWYEYQARSSYEAGEYKAAAAYYEKLANENDAYEVAYNLANSYYQLGRFDEAVILYEAIKSRDGVFKSDIYYNLGNAYARKEEFKKADAAYQKSLVLRYGKDADRNRQVASRAKKGYNPDSLKKKGSGERDKATAPKPKKGPKKESGGKENAQASSKVELSKEEASKLERAQHKKSLTYKQYQLINERAGSSETHPW